MDHDEFYRQVRALHGVADTMAGPSLPIVRLLLTVIQVCLKNPDLAADLAKISQDRDPAMTR